MLKKCVIFKIDNDSQKEIISFLTVKEFLTYFFLVSKKLTKNYENLVYHTIRKYLLSSWNIHDDDIIFQFLQNIFSQEYNHKHPITVEHLHDCMFTQKIQRFKSLLFKSYPILESYRSENPEHINVYEIIFSRANRSTVAASIAKYIPNKSNSSVNFNANTSKMIQYTGPIGLGNRSIMLLQPCPVKVDRMKELSDEINQIYQQSIRFNTHLNAFIQNQGSTGNNTAINTISVAGESNVNASSASYSTRAGTYLPNLSMLPSMLTIPASISLESFLATAKVLNKLYKILKKSTASSCDERSSQPSFCTPFVCKNSRINEYQSVVSENSRHDASQSLMTPQDATRFALKPGIDGIAAADMYSSLSQDCKLITSCGVRSVAYFEVSIKNYLSRNRSSNVNLQLSSTGGGSSAESLGRVRSSRSLQSLAQYFSTNTTTASSSSASPSSSSGVDCVAVGLATDNFDNHFKFPGWDCESYGYHGDDGATFHGNGHQLTQYGPSFGPGDTIGCGLDYIHKTVFFTLNGVNLGVAFDNINTAVPYYPTLGIDCNNPIEVNFGNKKPFEFDLYHFVESSAASSCLGDNNSASVATASE